MKILNQWLPTIIVNICIVFNLVDSNSSAICLLHIMMCSHHWNKPHIRTAEERDWELFQFSNEIVHNSKIESHIRLRLWITYQFTFCLESEISIRHNYIIFVCAQNVCMHVHGDIYIYIYIVAQRCRLYIDLCRLVHYLPRVDVGLIWQNTNFLMIPVASICT